MQVILLKDIKNIGKRGSVVTVADGYAMNVLIPQKSAAPATPENVKRAEREAMAAQGKKDMDAALAKRALAQIDGKKFTLRVKANEAGGLFKAIHEREIGEAILTETGISLPGHAITLKEPIKKTGSYSVLVSVSDAKATITLQLVA